MRGSKFSDASGGREDKRLDVGYVKRFSIAFESL
jgi:hypothetical protein